jgi:hypothetical protein
MELLEVLFENHVVVGQIALLWEALYYPSLATSTWNILKNWHLTLHNTDHPYGSVTLMTHLWSGLKAKSAYRIPFSSLWK